MSIRFPTPLVLSMLLFAACSTNPAPPSDMSQATDSETPSALGHPFFNRLVGDWEGTVTTWLEPDKIYDESSIRGTFAPAINGRFLRHTYDGFMKDKPRNGEELFAFNPIIKKFEVTWVDSFHMSQAILFSDGSEIENGFSVFGTWDAGEGIPKWGWRTDYVLNGDDELIVTSYVVTPEGEESKGVELIYHRIVQ